MTVGMIRILDVEDDNDAEQKLAVEDDIQGVLQSWQPPKSFYVPKLDILEKK